MPTVPARRTRTIDAAGQSLGRVASAAARFLQGKHRPTYAPHRDEGETVVVVNLEQVKFTGKKFDQKTYFQFSGYPGGLRRGALKMLWAKDPAAVLRRVVTQMLPANTLRKKWLTRLKVPPKS